MNDEQPLYVNPFRVRAFGGGAVALGGVRNRILTHSGRLDFLHGNNAPLPAGAVDGAELAWMRSDNFLVPEPLPLEHPYASQLGFFSFWPDRPEERLERLARASVGLLGAGSLGSQVALMLTAAGVGRLVLC